MAGKNEWSEWDSLTSGEPARLVPDFGFHSEWGARSRERLKMARHSRSQEAVYAFARFLADGGTDYLARAIEFNDQAPEVRINPTKYVDALETLASSLAHKAIQCEISCFEGHQGKKWGAVITPIRHLAASIHRMARTGEIEEDCPFDEPLKLRGYDEEA